MSAEVNCLSKIITTVVTGSRVYEIDLVCGGARDCQKLRINRYPDEPKEEVINAVGKTELGSSPHTGTLISGEFENHCPNPQTEIN